MVENSKTVVLQDSIQDIVTKAELIQQLNALGIQKGMVVYVCPYTQTLAYVCGGMQAFIDALIQVIGYEGTIIMPTFTLHKQDPASKGSISFDRNQWDVLRDHALPFHKKLTAPDHSDPLVLQFLRNDGVLRSNHPLYSFAVWGKYARLLCDKHPLHFGLSRESVLGKLVQLNGYVLLAGAKYSQCSLFYAAQYQNDYRPIKIISVPIEEGGTLVWKDILDLDIDEKGFSVIGEVMEERKIVKKAYVNAGSLRFFSAKEAMLIASAYFQV